MTKQPTRYDTIVIKDSTSTAVPREVEGGQVVSWSAGHAIAEGNAYEEFAKAVMNGDFETLEEAEHAASRAQVKANLQREFGYD